MISNKTLISELVRDLAEQSYLDLIVFLKGAREEFEGTEWEYFIEVKGMLNGFNYGKIDEKYYFDFNYGCLNGTIFYDLNLEGGIAVEKQFDIWVNNINAPIATISMGFVDGKFVYEELYVYDESVSDEVAVAKKL